MKTIAKKKKTNVIWHAMARSVYHSAIINQRMVFFEMWFNQRKNFQKRKKKLVFLSVYV